MINSIRKSCNFAVFMTQSLITYFCQVFEVHPEEGISESQLIEEKLMQLDESLGMAFVRLQQAFEALAFVQRDVEMRTKIRDIWEIQCRTMKSRVQQSFQQFVELCKLTNGKLMLRWNFLIKIKVFFGIILVNQKKIPIFAARK